MVSQGGISADRKTGSRPIKARDKWLKYMTEKREMRVEYD